MHYSQSGSKPEDIPSAPSNGYKGKGWISWGDWLGTGTIAGKFKKYRPFSEARAFVQSLKLKGYEGWKEYCKNGDKPEDIPSNANVTYKEAGWINLGNWLGTNNRKGGWMPFEEAKAVVQSLNLKSIKEWKEYCKSGNKPDNIPTNPSGVYKNKGWTSWGDWLGTGIIANTLKKYRTIEEAKLLVCSLKLTSRNEWDIYCKSGNKPDDIPARPCHVYKDKGWTSWGDWLGTGVTVSHLREYQSFEDARTFVHMLNLKTGDQWKEYCKSGNKPDDIPADPRSVYKDKRWVSMGDWLGTNRVANQLREYKSFYDARAFVRTLKLKNESGWREYSKSGLRPSDIPAMPSRVYKDKGWIGLGDWLGKF